MSVKKEGVTMNKSGKVSHKSGPWIIHNRIENLELVSHDKHSKITAIEMGLGIVCGKYGRFKHAEQKEKDNQ